MITEEPITGRDEEDATFLGGEPSAETRRVLSVEESERLLAYIKASPRKPTGTMISAIKNYRAFL